MSNVVYKIDCKGCNNCYIGQTKNYLHSRLNNHKNDVKKHLNKTALSTHAITHQHSFDFNDTSILAQESNLKKRLFLEMAHILKYKTINFNRDIENLSHIYHNVIKS